MIIKVVVKAIIVYRNFLLSVAEPAGHLLSHGIAEFTQL